MKANTPIARRECEAAKAWRQSRGFTLVTLANLTGYSRRSIILFERGFSNDGREIDDENWLRYRHVCASVDVMMRSGRAFRWGATWQE